MEKVEKMRKILEIMGWSQARLARELDVSPKTLSLWLNGKGVPQQKRYETIDAFYDQALKEKSAKEGKFELDPVNDPEFSEKVLQGILLKEKEKTDPEDKYQRVKKNHKEYYNGKIVAKKLEEENFSRIIIFPSINEGARKEWYKVGGNSALFYKYYAGPRTGRSPRILDDSDLRCRFKNGVTMIHMGEKLLKDFEDVGFRVTEGEFGIIFVELDKVFKEKEVKEMDELERTNRERVKRMITPKENFPDIYGYVRKLAQILPPKVKKMDGAYRATFGEGVLNSIYEMYKIYFRMGNGRIGKEEAFVRILEQVDDITAVLAVADENNMFDLTTRIRIGEAITDLKTTLAKRSLQKDYKK